MAWGGKLYGCWLRGGVVYAHGEATRTAILVAPIFLAVATLTLRSVSAVTFQCPSDCNGNYTVTVSEVSIARNIALEYAALSTCPAADQNGDASVMINEVVKGMAAVFAGCDSMLPPAGFRGRVQTSSGTSIVGAAVDIWLWPPSESTDAFWVWPATGGPSILADTATFGSPAFGRLGPNYGFDGISGQCITGVEALNFGPGWVRMRVQKSGYNPGVFYRHLDFRELCFTYTSGTCTQAGNRSCDTQNLQLFSGVHEALPDIMLDVRQLERERKIRCVDMPTGKPDLRVLLVGIATPNVSRGPFKVEGINFLDEDSTNDFVRQHIFNTDGTLSRFVTLPSGGFEFDHGHAHIHFENWAQLDLVKDLLACVDPENRDDAACIVSGTGKLSFCVIDRRRFDDEVGGGTQVFSDCGLTQGISPGWMDVYDSAVVGQFVVLECQPPSLCPGFTTVPSGTYRVEAEVDPLEVLRSGAASTEVTRDNNFGTSAAFALAGGECGYLSGNWRCASPSGCVELDCTAVAPNCCPIDLPPPLSSQCNLCKQYFCHLDAMSPACQGLPPGCGS